MTNDHPEVEQLPLWDDVIEPPSSWLDLKLREVLKYKDLIVLFVKRDFVTFYKQTVLGPLWFILQPLLTSVVFTIIFSMIAGIPTDGVPPFLFYMAGSISWMLFSSCLVTTSTTFATNVNLLKKVYFPRLVIPVSVSISNFIKFLVQLGFFLAIYLYYFANNPDITPTIFIIAVPLFLLQTILLGMGVGLIVSALTIKYRDLQFAIGFCVQLWMYATPIVYPISKVPADLLFWYKLNPMVSVVTSFRHAFFASGLLEPSDFAVSAGITLVLLFAGLILFGRTEKNFIDTV